MNRFISRALLRGTLAMVVAALAGCSWFYPGPEEGERERVETHVKQGMKMDDALAEAQGLGYLCQWRTGPYYDEDGKERQAPRFLLCDKRPGLISFYCTTRDQVVVVDDAEHVSSVHVVSGPSCINNARPGE